MDQKLSGHAKYNRFMSTRNRYTFSLSSVVFKLIKRSWQTDNRHQNCCSVRTLGVCLKNVKCLKPINMPVARHGNFQVAKTIRYTKSWTQLLNYRRRRRKKLRTHRMQTIELYQGCPTRGPAGCVTRPAATFVKYVKISPITGPRCSEGSRKLRFPDYVTMAQDGGKVFSLTHRPLLPPGYTPGTHFC